MRRFLALTRDPRWTGVIPRSHHHGSPASSCSWPSSCLSDWASRAVGLGVSSITHQSGPDHRPRITLPSLPNCRALIIVSSGYSCLDIPLLVTVIIGRLSTSAAAAASASAIVNQCLRRRRAAPSSASIVWSSPSCGAIRLYRSLSCPAETSSRCSRWTREQRARKKHRRSVFFAFGVPPSTSLVLCSSCSGYLTETKRACTTPPPRSSRGLSPSREASNKRGVTTA